MNDFFFFFFELVNEWLWSTIINGSFLWLWLKSSIAGSHEKKNVKAFILLNFCLVWSLRLRFFKLVNIQSRDVSPCYLHIKWVCLYWLWQRVCKSCPRFDCICWGLSDLSPIFLFLSACFRLLGHLISFLWDFASLALCVGWVMYALYILCHVFCE